MSEMLTLEKFEEASEIAKQVTSETKLMYSEFLSNQTGNKVYLKPENMQLTGAYKLRGAYYKISQLSDEEKKKGVIACSAGNHAQGVALAAAKNGIKAKICIPDGAPISKVEATKSYGAEVCLVKGVYDDAYEKAVSLVEETGATFIHPFDDEMVIAGQGSIGLEIIEQLPKVDAVIVPIGGGGLISGVGFALKSLDPDIKIYGVQAEGAASMVKSIKDDEIETLEDVHTIADGIAVKTPGVNTFEICRKYVDDIVTVSDDEISTAILELIEREKMIAEGAGATSVAAAMFNKLPIKGKNVVCLVSGGNIDVTILSRVINRGLQKAGRLAELVVELTDKPGQLLGVSEIISSYGANVVSLEHNRSDERLDINDCVLRISIETRNQEHLDEIKDALVNGGFKIK